MLTPVDLEVLSLAKELTGKRCLLTGASGFLGRNMIAVLLLAKAEVHIVTHRRNQQEIPMGIYTSAHKCDLGCMDEVEKLYLDVQPEYVFHFATARGDPNKERNTYIRDNILVADNLIRASLKWTPICMVVGQSSLEYGPHSYPLSESTYLHPNTLHGATKAASGLLFQEAAYSMGLPIVILRIFSIYGYWEPRKRFIPTVMDAIKNKKSIPLTAGKYQRDFVFVMDVVEACIRSALKPNIGGEIFNIGTGIQTENKEVVQMLESIAAVSIVIDEENYIPHKTDTAFWVADNKKAFTLLHWYPKHSLFDGLEKTWEWYQKSVPYYE